MSVRPPTCLSLTSRPTHLYRPHSNHPPHFFHVRSPCAPAVASLTCKRPEICRGGGGGGGCCCCSDAAAAADTIAAAAAATISQRRDHDAPHPDDSPRAQTIRKLRQDHPSPTRHPGAASVHPIPYSDNSQGLRRLSSPLRHHISTSTHQHINTAHQHISTSALRRRGRKNTTTSRHRGVGTRLLVTHQHISTCTTASAHQHISTAAYQYINTTTQQDSNT